jgi:hypothetical protein
MTNPFDPAYLTAPSPQLGLFAWLFFALQLAALLGGLYIIFLRDDTHAARQAVWRQLGIALAVLGGVGLLLAVLRLANLPVFNQRYWFYLQLLIELGFAAYVFYYARTTYPQVIATRQASRSSASVRRAGAAPARPPASSQPSQAANGSSASNAPRSMPNSSRREARRERKRRNK